MVLGLYMVFFKSYFQENGKNLATKEDIGKITAEVEKVKSGISILTHSKITLASERRNALMDFNNKYSAYLQYLINLNILLRLISHLGQNCL